MRRYLAFFMLALALGVAPGPDILFVFAQSLAHGAGSGSVVTLVVFNGVSALGGSIAWLFDGDSGILRVLRYFSAVIILGLAGWIVVMNLRHRDRVGTDGDPRSGEGPAGA